MADTDDRHEALAAHGWTKTAISEWGDEFTNPNVADLTIIVTGGTFGWLAVEGMAIMAHSRYGTPLADHLAAL